MPFIFRFSSFWEWRFERESIGLLVALNHGHVIRTGSARSVVKGK